MLCPFCAKQVLSVTISKGVAFFVHGTRGNFSAGCLAEVRKLVRTNPDKAIPSSYLEAEQLGPLELLQSIGAQDEPVAAAVFGCIRCGGAWSSAAERLEHECRGLDAQLEKMPDAAHGAWLDLLELMRDQDDELARRRPRARESEPARCDCAECRADRNRRSL